MKKAAISLAAIALLALLPLAVGAVNIKSVPIYASGERANYLFMAYVVGPSNTVSCFTSVAEMPEVLCWVPEGPPDNGVLTLKSFKTRIVDVSAM
jgi:hypothetical protein